MVPPHGQYGTVTGHDCGVHALHVLCHSNLFKAVDLKMAAASLCDQHGQGVLTVEDLVSDENMRLDFSIMQWLAQVFMGDGGEPFTRIQLPGVNRGRWFFFAFGTVEVHMHMCIHGC